MDDPTDPLEDLPFDPPFALLLELSTSNKALFRIHTPSSASRLIWTGSMLTSGFTSPNIHLGSLTPSSYEVMHRLLPRPLLPFHPLLLPELTGRGTGKSDDRGGLRLISGPYLRHTIVDHILGKARQTCIPQLPTMEEKKEGIWDDELTPWISASGSLFWCIWEIARRLAIPADTPGWVGEVEMAILRHPAIHLSVRSTFHVGDVHDSALGKKDGSKNQVDGKNIILDNPQSSIPVPEKKHDRNTEERTSKNDKKPSEDNHPLSLPPEIYLRPFDHLNPQTHPGEMSVSLKEQYEAARKASLACVEILFFGRIWAENVASNLAWTRERPAVELPPHLFITSYTQPQDTPHAPWTSAANTNLARQPPATHSTRERSSKTKSSWIERLVWDPREDEYLSALEKVIKHRRELAKHEGVPVAEWPRTPLN